jgi:hypothetical protein
MEALHSVRIWTVLEKNEVPEHGLTVFTKFSYHFYVLGKGLQPPSHQKKIGRNLVIFVSCHYFRLYIPK